MFGVIIYLCNTDLTHPLLCCVWKPFCPELWRRIRSFLSLWYQESDSSPSMLHRVSHMANKSKLQFLTGESIIWYETLRLLFRWPFTYCEPLAILDWTTCNTTLNNTDFIVICAIYSKHLWFPVNMHWRTWLIQLLNYNIVVIFVILILEHNLFQFTGGINQPSMPFLRSIKEDWPISSGYKGGK